MTFLVRNGRHARLIPFLYAVLSLVWFGMSVRMFMVDTLNPSHMALIPLALCAIMVAGYADYRSTDWNGRFQQMLAPLMCGIPAAFVALVPLDFGLQLNFAGYLLLAFAALHAVLAFLLFRAFAPVTPAP